MTPDRTSDNSKRQVGLAAGAWQGMPAWGLVQHPQNFWSKKPLTWPSLLKAEVPCKGKSSFRMCLAEIPSTRGSDHPERNADQSINPKKPRVGVFKIYLCKIQTLAKAKPLNQKSKIQFNSKFQHPNVWIWILSADRKSGSDVDTFQVLKQEAA